MKSTAQRVANFSLLVVLALVTISCTVLTAPRPTATQVPAEAEPTTAVPTAPAATAAPTLPTPTLRLPTAAVSTMPPPARPEVSEVLIYMVALEDNGASGQAIGCGDSLVPVRRAVSPTSDAVTAALAELFSVGTQYYGESGFYNALYQSALQVSSVSYAADGTPTVSINGSHQLGGTCDTPRFYSQIMQTILSAAGTQGAVVTLNGEPLKEALSQQ